MGFKGDVVTKWLCHEGNDRDMELVQDFSFTDSKGVVWNAPKGSVVNGASIPRFLWEEIGSPYVGDYRRASVLHDVGCHLMLKTPKEVHRMFYEAMLCDGVNMSKALYMYAAVRLFSRRWKNKQILKETQHVISDFEAANLYNVATLGFPALEKRIKGMIA